MSLKKNIAANYFSQAYVAGAGILTVPAYIHYLGAEAYGLVGFFAMFQVLFQLMDVGLGPALAREITRYRAGTLPGHALWSLFRSLENLFLFIGVVSAISMLWGAPYIALHWLHGNTISTDVLTLCVQLMVLAVPARWVAGLYRSVLSGQERLVWLAGFNAAIATARFPGALIILHFYSATISAFFSYQLILAIVECTVLLAAARHGLIEVRSTEPLPLAAQWTQIRGLGRFSLAIALTASIWIIVTQLDKLLLSNVLTLEEYGYYSLAIIAAGGINLLVAPIQQSLMPSLARLHAAGDYAALLDAYRRGSRWACLATLPVALLLSVFAEPMLRVWTGNEAVARAASPILAGYAIGNALLAMTAFPYLLQFARGTLRMHVQGNLLLIAILVPGYLWAGPVYGAAGASLVWLGAMSFCFFIWVPYSHARLQPGLQGPWILDTSRIAVPCIALALLLNHWIDWPERRDTGMLTALGIWALLLLTGLVATTGSPLLHRFCQSRLARTRTSSTSSS